MNERVLKWLKANKGKVFASPRNTVFKEKTMDFQLLDVSDGRVKIHFVGSKYQALPLYFWMFDRTLDYLRKSKDRPIALGANVRPPYNPGTIEEQIWKDEMGIHPYKASPHVCDILALAGLVKYVYVLNPRTRRKVQGVKLIDTE
jgi:hypothetical protein